MIACMEPASALLKPHALAQIARWLNADLDLDLIYSDEDQVDENDHLSSPELKPDWSHDQLLSQNYIGHLAVLRRTVVRGGPGGFRSAFDGSHVSTTSFCG